jgi:hypothetical protein
VHITRDSTAKVFRCEHCREEESYAHVRQVGELIALRRTFTEIHQSCPMPEPQTLALVTAPKEEEEPMSKERKPASCSLCGETGHNATTCSKRPAAAAPKNRGGADVQEAGPRDRSPETGGAGDRGRFGSERNHPPPQELDRIGDDRGRRVRDPRPGGLT